MDGLVLFARWRQCAPHILKVKNGYCFNIPYSVEIGYVFIRLLDSENPPGPPLESDILLLAIIQPKL